MRPYDIDAALFEFVASPEPSGWNRVDWPQYNQAVGDTFSALSR